MSEIKLSNGEIQRLIDYHKSIISTFEEQKAKEIKYYDERIQTHETQITELNGLLQESTNEAK